MMSTAPCCVVQLGFERSRRCQRHRHEFGLAWIKLVFVRLAC
ncbi:hypothetical protein AAHH84_00310 [Candidatus Hodgkinia cicadicola]